jgi:hypothetical protein
MKTIEEICRYIGSVIDECPTCVETGCVYSILDASNKCDGSTNNIAEFICSPRNGVFYSLDNNAGKMLNSIGLVQKYAPSVPFYPMIGESVDSLKILAIRGTKIDVLCLDSQEGDPQHGLDEFLAVENNLKEKHFVLIDDVLNEPSVKWRKVVPYLLDHGYETLIVRTPVGNMVATKGYTLPKD